MRTRGRKQDVVDGESDEVSSSRRSSSDEIKTPTVVSLTKLEGPIVSTPGQSSKLPPAIQFPLVAVLSLSLSALGHALTYSYTKAVLAPNARVPETWAETGLLTGWKVAELALGWYGNYDGYDLAALSLLTHGPPLHLLSSFYNTPTSALLLTLTIETLATYLPFRLLRPLSPAHGDPAHVPNADIVTDRPIALLTTLLAGAIYSISLYFAYATYLPSYLAVYFNALPTLLPAQEATYVQLLPTTLALGFAARTFIFTPAEAVGHTPADDEHARFDPVDATLPETLRWNLLGWTSQTKKVFERTSILALATAVNTALQLRFTLIGVETPGAIAWSSVWVLAALVTGLALGVVGSV
jgi:hypothetical protein